MPGIVVFKRRWSVGSDDLVVPAVFLLVLHLVWIVVLGVILGVVEFDLSQECSSNLREHVLGYLVILSCCAIVEGSAALVSVRGTILYTEPRTSMQYILYIRLGILIVEFVWLVLGVVWVWQHFTSCTESPAKKAVLGIVVCNWLIMFSVFISLWCTFDPAGRSWVKMKRYQDSLKDREQRPNHKRCSGSRRRNWRNRTQSNLEREVAKTFQKAIRAYEESWDRRCRFLFCCVREDRHRSSFTEVAKLFTEFFRDLDVVPTDIIAGLVLLRKHQKMRRKFVVCQGNNEVYQFLSGVPITPSSRFLSLKDPVALVEYQLVVHYVRYAAAAYGWPMFMMIHTGTGLCKIMPSLSCCCCMPCQKKRERPVLLEDNCCNCHYAALTKLIGHKEAELVYITYHVDIEETPFFIAIDHGQKTVVLSVRGTLSLQDVLTDLKADCEPLPVTPPKEDWLGHKGIVQNALYIKKKLKNEQLLEKAFGKDVDRGTQDYDLILVGHSLGAGTAVILAILLREEYPNLQCYAFSPPGGLLSAACVEETKSFITSVVLGKDVVPRIGLHQLEALRQDLINVIKKSTKPKWKIIGGSLVCCGGDGENDGNLMQTYDVMKQEKETHNFLHPSDSNIALTTHSPLYPPGRIIHIVRNHPKTTGNICKKPEPVYQAVWADNCDFDEVLISPTMINDHMADTVMEALQKVLTNTSPAKPSRKLPDSERRVLLSSEVTQSDNTPPSGRRILESSFSNPPPSEAEMTRLSLAYSLPSDANSLSWDYVLPTHHGQAGDIVDGRQTFPPRARPSLKLDFSKDEWAGVAPLASPETLSETSSMDSLSSRKRLSGYNKISADAPRLEPIKQSPLRQAHPDGYCYFVQPPSPVDYSDSPEKEFGHLSSQAPMDPLAQSTPIKDPRSTQVGQNDGDDWPSSLTSADVHRELPLAESIDNSCACQEDNTTMDLTAIGKKIQGKISDIESADPYKLTYENETGIDGVDFLRHSPDSGNQIPYDAVKGFYSPAGRGYPHGAYMLPSPDNSYCDENGFNAIQEQHNYSPLEQSPEVADVESITPTQHQNGCAIETTTVEANHCPATKGRMTEDSLLRNGAVTEWPS